MEGRMPYSKQTFPYTGGARTFTIALAMGYIETDDIRVYVVGEVDGGSNQLYRTFTFDSEFVVNVTEEIDNPSSVVVERTVSPSAFDIDFTTGSDITPANLMTAFKQNFMLMQEILDGRVDDIDVAAQATLAAASATAAAASSTSATASAAAAAASAAAIDAAEVIVRDGSIPFTATITGVAPTSDLHLATKKYVDDTVGGGGAMLLDGTAQMTAAMLLVAASPTLDDHATRKLYVDTALALKATLASPALTGNPTAPTQTADDNSTKIATTAYVDTAIGSGGDWTLVETLFDWAVDGDTHEVETSTLVDGYEYAIFVDAVGNNNAGTAYLSIDFSRETGGYDGLSRNVWHIGTASADVLDGIIYLPTARLAVANHYAHGQLKNDGSHQTSDGTHTASGGVFKLNKVKMQVNVGNMEEGELFLYRKAL